MGVRERVQRAIESPVAEAERVLAETPHAKPHDRLSILMNGWFRGIAGALDELAIELESLRTAEPPPAPEPAQRAQRAQRQSADEQPPENEPAGPEERAEPEATEAELAERARASRAETEAVRAERDSEAEGEGASGEPGPTASTPQAEEP